MQRRFLWRRAWVDSSGGLERSNWKCMACLSRKTTRVWLDGTRTLKRTWRRKTMDWSVTRDRQSGQWGWERRGIGIREKTKTRETGNKGQREWEREREKKKFKYNECGKTRPGQDKLRRHMRRIHENEKGFAVGMRQIEIGWGKHIQEAVLRERKIQLFPALLRFPWIQYCTEFKGSDNSLNSAEIQWHYHFSVKFQTFSGLTSETKTLLVGMRDDILNVSFCFLKLTFKWGVFLQIVKKCKSSAHSNMSISIYNIYIINWCDF